MVYKNWNVYQVNKTFQALDFVEDLYDAWEELGPRVKSFMESSLEIQQLKVCHQDWVLQS